MTHSAPDFDPRRTSETQTPSKEPTVPDLSTARLTAADQEEADDGFRLHRIPKVVAPPQWNAFRDLPTFQEAVEIGVLTDVSEAAKRWGLTAPVFLNRELQDDLAARLPGELGGMTYEARLETVLAQVGTLLTQRCVDSLDRDETITFADAIEYHDTVDFRLKLPLLADTAQNRPRAQGMDRCSRSSHTFEPYALYVMMETDQVGAYGMVLALAHPFSKVGEPQPSRG